MTSHAKNYLGSSFSISDRNFILLLVHSFAAEDSFDTNEANAWISFLKSSIICFSESVDREHLLDNMRIILFTIVWSTLQAASKIWYRYEAQLVWDKVMAINALAYLKAHPHVSMVLLTGTGHAWKRGIPEQIRQRSPLPYTVIFPRVPGYVEPGFVTEKDADYIMLDLPK